MLEAQGSWLTNKYAEGLPGKRYYGGCEYVDVVERLAQERALALFPGAEHVNVQPHSGAQANMAAYFSVLKPGDRILGMNLAHGGHLTHGMAVNFRGKLYEVHAYGVREDDERIDYDALERQAREVRPKMIVAGASAYPRIIDFERMAAIAAASTRCCSWTWPTSPGSSRRACIPARSRTRTSSPRPPTRPCAARAAASSSRAPSSAQAVDKAVFPGIQGGPLMHVIAAKAVALKLAPRSRVPGGPAARPSRTPQVLAATLAEHGAQARLRRHGQPPDARRRDARWA